jgi:DNA-binding SARP family transcriptional activator
MFGSMHVSYRHTKSELRLSRILRALLAYLLLFRNKLHTRDVLANLLWGEHAEKKAKSCLSTALWRLRSIIEQGTVQKGTYLISTPTGEVGFNHLSNHWLDVSVFEEKLKPVIELPVEKISEATANRLDYTLKLYVGDLLEGFYDDWILEERERFKALYINSLEKLMMFYGSQGSLDRAIMYGHEVLRNDPLREEIHRELMRLYMESGQSSKAMQHYKRCQQILEAELAVEPMQETQEMYASITQTVKKELPILKKESKAKSVKMVTPMKTALNELKHAVKSVEKLHRSLLRTVESIEHWQDTHE